MSGAELLAKYGDAASGANSGVDVKNMVKPQWRNWKELAPYADALNCLDANSGSKSGLSAETVKGFMLILQLQDTDALKYTLTVVYDMLRSDSSTFAAFDEAYKANADIFAPMKSFMGSCKDAYLSDKCAWILSAALAHISKAPQDMTVVTCMFDGASCSDLGYLEAATNLLKSEALRNCLRGNQTLLPCVTKGLCSKNSAMTYKGVFAIWMFSFDTTCESANLLDELSAVERLKTVMSDCRTEKVIRLSLTVLKNFLANKSAFKAINEKIVEEGLLEVVQALEYEKWRDAELYDDIKEVCGMVSSEVKEMSNFNRYMKELESGNLSWGFIHSSKFFGENIMKFSTGDFKAVKMLAHLVAQDSNNTTLAVACHDIGQFVALHPDGKREVARLGVKERVMDLMASNDADQREVRREALLCCQKIMLNKWQEAAK
jgi:V-type H+-transporting ATPase subunit H